MKKAAFILFSLAAGAAALPAFAAGDALYPEAISAKELLPGPPAAGTWRSAADDASYREGLSLRNAPRGLQAAEDADMSPLKAFEARFSKPLGVQISKDATPATHAFLLLTMKRVYPSLKAGKEVFRRPRPVVPHPEDATCRPDLAKKFDRFASYPSGHTTMAWALALALTSVAPGDPVPVLKLGYSAGDSRAICGAHWQSDVEAGRELAAAVYARITGNPDYLAAAAASRAELRKLSKPASFPVR